MKKTNLAAIVFASFLFASSSVLAAAAPRFTFSPTSNSYTVGNEFTVDVGVNSDTEKVVAIDIVGTFNKDILEIVKIEKNSPDTGFKFLWDVTSTPKFSNTAGTFSAPLVPDSSTSLDGIVANQTLIKVTFKAKAVGTGNVGLTCQQGSVNDTNILNPSSVDVTTCSSNQAGSYIINASSATTTTNNPTATPTPTTSSTTTATTLPETGSLGATVGLVVFGVVCVLGALFLGLL